MKFTIKKIENVLIAILVIIGVGFINSCGPSAREEYEARLKNSVQKDSSYSAYLDLSGMDGTVKWRGCEYMVARGYYGNFLVPVNNTNEIKKIFTDYLKIKEQHIMDSMVILNNQLEINFLKDKIKGLNSRIVFLEKLNK